MDFTAYLASQHQNEMFGSDEGPKITTAIFNKLKELPEIKLSNYAYKNGVSGFEDVTKSWGLARPSFSNGAAYADLDNDGDLDYVVNNINDKAFFYENTVSNLPNRHWLRVKLIGEKGNKSAFGVKLKLYTQGKVQYREMSPIRGYVSSVENTAHFGLGATLRPDSLLVFWPNGTKQKIQLNIVDTTITVGYKKEEVFDSIFSKLTEKQLFSKTKGVGFQHIENEFNDFNQTPILPYKLSRVSPILAVGDANGDGLEDVFIGTDFRFQAELHFQQKNGTFVRQLLIESEKFENTDAVFFDADKDGDQDLYVVNGGSHQEGESAWYGDLFYQNDGKGRFSPMKVGMPEAMSSGSSIDIADFDGDGDLDLARGGRCVSGKYPTSPRSFILVNESTKNQIKFTDKTQQIAPDFSTIGMVTDLAWCDTDKDGDLDLWAVGEWMTPVLFVNLKGKLNPTKIPENLSGWWQSLLPSDIDNDGDIDLLLGNVGTNNKYKVSPKTPVRVYAKDFDNNGRFDPILSFYLVGKEVPVPNRDLLLMQIPPLKKHYQQYQSFAGTSMSDLLKKLPQEEMLLREANEFRSGWLESKGKSGFVFHAFVDEAQFSVVKKIVALPGKKWLLLGNSYAPETGGGWLDASLGTVLDAQCKPIQNTGLCLDKEASCGVIVKSKTNQLLMISNRNSYLQTYKYQ